MARFPEAVCTLIDAAADHPVILIPAAALTQSGAKVLVPRPKGDLLPDYVDKQVRKAILESRAE